jgi:hypothetical protein
MPLQVLRRLAGGNKFLLMRDTVNNKAQIKKGASQTKKLGKPFFQPKLSINQPNDIYEQEADAIAEKIMRKPAIENEPTFFSPKPLTVTPVQRKCDACEEEERLQRKEEKDEPVQMKPEKEFDIRRTCDACAEEKMIQMKPSSRVIQRDDDTGGAPEVKSDVPETGPFHLQREESDDNEAPDVTPSVEETLQLVGQPIDEDARTFMEESFGADFSDVQIHDDSLANQSSSDINALAYTHQNHIVFGEGQYDPQTEEGRELLAHELTHVLQQTGTVQRAPQKSTATCEKGHQPYSGFNVRPPLKYSFSADTETTHTYGYWITWHTGDHIRDVLKSSFPEWVKWRYSKGVPQDKVDRMLEFLLRKWVSLQKEPDLKDGCQYQVLFADYMYIYFNSEAGEYENVPEGGESVGKGSKKGDGTKPLSNPFAGLKKEDQEKLLKLLKEIAGDLVKDDKKVPKEFPLSSNDIKALLQLADDPQKDKIIEFLKAKTGGGTSSVKSIEELIAIAKISEIYKRFNVETEKGEERQEPVVSQPVHGFIIQGDPLIVPNKTVSFGFEVKDNVDALRVPWVTIRWFAYTDPLKNDAQSPAPAGWKDQNWNRYMPIESEGTLNNKHYKVEFPAEGIYTVEAIVDHNFFLPNSFRTSVKVIDEKKALQEKEDKLYKGFLGPGETKATDFGQLAYSEGTVTTGKIDPNFAGTTIEKQAEGINQEIDRITKIIEEYKKSQSKESASMVEWGEKYLEKLKKNKETIEAYSAGKGVNIIPTSGTYISRTLGVRSMDLKLTSFISKVPAPAPSSEFDTGSTDDWYRVSVFDYTQLYENDNYNFTADSPTAEGAMKSVFSKMSEEYPDGQISIAFQKWDEAGEKLSGDYVKYNRVTDTIYNKVKKVVFSAPVGIAVNIISAILTVFPPTSAIGLTIGIVYNTAATFSEVMDMAEKGTLTLTKGALAAGSVLLDVIPIVGNLGKAAKVVRMGTKAYYVIEGVQLAGQAFLLYENGVEQIEKLRTDYFLKIADLDEQITEMTAKNPSDPDIDKLKKERDELIKKGETASVDTFASMFAEQGIFIVGGKVLHGLGEHLKTTSKLKERGRIADSLTGVSKLNEGERLSIADRIYNGEVDVRASKETGWKLDKESGKHVLEIADDATHAQISELLDKNPNPKPTAEPHLTGPDESKEKKATGDEPASRQPKSETKETKTSPVADQGEPFVTATKETHEHRVHEDGTITRCSDRCIILSTDAKARAGEIKEVYGKEHPNTKKAKELAEQAKALEKESKKAAAIKDETQRKAKEDEILGKAKQLELELATLENGMGAELNARVETSLVAIDEFLKDYPEQRGRFKTKIDNRQKRRAEIAPKLNDPDPAIRKKALEEIMALENSTVELRKEIPKYIENLTKPDISQRYVYDDKKTNSRGDYIKSASGELGVPGEVMKKRDETAQGKVSSGTGDDAGHLIANSFGGAGGQENLGRQNWIANEFGSWRKLEIEWARKLLSGVKIFVEVRELSRAKGERPYMRTVSWTEIDAAGNKTNHYLSFGNFESVKSRAASGAAPTPGVPEGGGQVFIWNEERSKRGLEPVYSREEMDAMLKGLDTKAANETAVFEAANDNNEIE